MITGGNRGIGADVVEKLLECEINVIMGEFLSDNQNSGIEDDWHFRSRQVELVSKVIHTFSFGCACYQIYGVHVL